MADPAIFLEIITYIFQRTPPTADCNEPLRNSWKIIIEMPKVAFTFGSGIDNLLLGWKSRKENPQKLTQLSSRSYPRHLVGKRTAQKYTIIDITSDSQVNSNFPYRSPASLTFNNYFYLFFIFIYNVNNHK